MSCSSGKRAYATARVARVEAAREAKVARIPLGIYRCPLCRGWHMTKKLEGGTRIAGGRAYYGPRCTVCRVLGHNRRTCPQAVA